MADRRIFPLDSAAARGVHGALVAFFAAFLLLPVAWMVVTSFKPPGEIFAQFPTPWPAAPTLDNYAHALGRSRLPLYLLNSALTAGGSALLTTALAASAAYGFAKFRFFGQRPLMLGMIAAQMFPFALVLISLYPLLQDWGLLNTRLGLVLGYVVFALPPGMYIMYAFFIQVPDELIEAARVDGAGEMRIVRLVVLPLSLPALISVALYAFMWAWNDLLYALTLVTQDDLRTIGPGLLLQFFGEMQQDWGGAMAASILASAPTVALFALLQRHFLQGLMVGAVKG
jgi:multiple sugar transport system permease protein